MRAGLAALAALWFCASAGAQEASSFGPIRFGMSYDAVRAAAPGAWSEMEHGGILGRDVVTVAGEAFDAEYEIEAWDRARILAYTVEDNPDYAACERRFLALGAALEAQYGAFDRGPDTPARDLLFDARQETLRFGERSRAKVVRRIDGARPATEWEFEASAGAGRTPYTVSIHAAAHRD
jgi:hypothetical protein